MGSNEGVCSRHILNSRFPLTAPQFVLVCLIVFEAPDVLRCWALQTRRCTQKIVLSLATWHVWRRHTPLPVDLHDADLDLAIGILRQLSRHRPSARSLKLLCDVTHELKKSWQIFLGHALDFGIKFALVQVVEWPQRQALLYTVLDVILPAHISNLLHHSLLLRCTETQHQHSGNAVLCSDECRRKHRHNIISVAGGQYHVECAYARYKRRHVNTR